MSEQNDTKTKMIDAAERLFSEKGVDAVQLREIIEAAGQRNTSALQYHFKSREGLVEAVFKRRMAPINKLRLSMLSEVLESREPITAMVLARAIVLPLAHELFRATKPTYYASFLAQVLTSSHHFAALQGAEHYSGIRECTLHYRHIMPDLDLDLLNRRIRMAISSTVREFAFIEREIRKSGKFSDRDLIYVAVGNVVDAVAGILAAPPQASETPKDLERSIKALNATSLVEAHLI